MGKYRKRYVDGSGVQRGYYVYAHRCTVTKKVFYIGKGHTNRAWSTRRNYRWQEYVDKLPAGYDVVLLHEDLTETEAFDIEANEIAKNGGAASVGGSLINWLPRGTMAGDLGPSVLIGFAGKCSESAEERKIRREREEAYKSVRKFRDLQGDELRDAVVGFNQIAGESSRRVADRCWRLEEEMEEGPPEYLTCARDLILEICELADRVLARKISYYDFCETLSEKVAELEENAVGILERSVARPLVVKNVRHVKRWQAAFEFPGNRERAVAARRDVEERQFIAEHGVTRDSVEGKAIQLQVYEEMVELLEKLAGNQGDSVGNACVRKSW